MLNDENEYFKCFKLLHTVKTNINILFPDIYTKTNGNRALGM